VHATGRGGIGSFKGVSREGRYGAWLSRHAPLFFLPARRANQAGETSAYSYSNNPGDGIRFMDIFIQQILKTKDRHQERAWKS
jgi:hypothetical protein